MSAPIAPLTVQPRSTHQGSRAASVGPGHWLSSASVRLGLGVALFGTLVTVAVLVTSGGIPFVTDGNESFATYNHGANLLRFGLAATMGLTDEVSSPDAAAHPYIYTHQGNLPRFASALLLLLGVKSMAWHVILISLVGSATSTVLCFRFFARAAGPLFASLVCVVFWTDYLLFVQWQANSFRVWHSVLLFGGLVCAQALGSSRGLGSRIGLLAISACLFYFEFIFAAFACAFITIYSLLEYRRRLHLALLTVTLTAVGGGLAIALLGMQLLSYLGPNQVLRDLQVTYFARNFAGDLGNAAARAKVLQFFMENHVVFWDSFDATPYMSLSAFARTVTSTVLVVYTPLLVTISGVILGSLALGSVRGLGSFGRPGLAIPLGGIGRRASDWVGGWLTPQRIPISWPARWLKPGVVARWMTLLVSAVLATDSLAAAPTVPLISGGSVVSVGFPRTFGGEFGPSQLLLAAAAIGALLVQVFGLRPDPPRPPWRRLLPLFALSLALAGWLAAQRDLYPFRSAALWRGYFQATLPAVALQIILVGAWVLAGMLLLSGTGRALTASPTVRVVGRYLAAGALAFLLVYLLSPGYLYGGYLSRYAPLPVFVTDVVFALLLYVLLQLASPLRSVIVAVAGRRRPVLRKATVSTLASVLLMFVCGYWVWVQATYVTYIPPDSAAFLEQLAGPPFRGASFASDNYALPITMYTTNWAFQDHLLAQRRSVDSNGPVVEISGKYMWFRDRDDNPEYLKPDYYLCRIMHNLDTVADLIVLPAGQRVRRCTSEPLVQRAVDGGPDRLVASDPSPADAWAIVQLDPSIELRPTWRDVPVASTPTPAAAAPSTAPSPSGANLKYAFRAGFYDSEGDRAPLPRWTDGHGVLEIYPPAAGDLVLVLDLVQPDFGYRRTAPNMSVSADGHPTSVDEWRVEQPVPGHYTVQLPLLARAPGVAITLTLQSGTFVPIEHEPASTDQRRLGVRIEGIRSGNPTERALTTVGWGHASADAERH